MDRKETDRKRDTQKDGREIEVEIERERNRLSYLCQTQETSLPI